LSTGALVLNGLPKAHMPAHLSRSQLLKRWLITAAFAAAAITLLILAAKAYATQGSAPWASLALPLIGFAALPWASFKPPNRALGFACLVYAAFLALGVLRTAGGDVTFPRSCTGPNAAFCHLDNWLFDAGGAWLAALPSAIPCAILLAFGVRTILLARK
jgi:hypothetical protein